MKYFNYFKCLVFVIISCLVLVFLVQEVQVQEEEENKFSMNVMLNFDQFFGFYFFFFGGYSVSDKMDFIFYGIFWFGGIGGGWGNWIEFGMGVSF